MSIKLSPLALAIAGAMTLSAVPAMAKDAPVYEKDAILVVYKDNVTKAERAAAQRLIRGTLTDANADGVDDKFQHVPMQISTRQRLGKSPRVARMW